MKVLIYTCIINHYDILQDVSNLQRDNVNFLCITDSYTQKQMEKKGWNKGIIITDKNTDSVKLNDIFKNRFYKLAIHNKVHPIHMFDSDIHVYLDTNKWIHNIDLLMKYCKQLYESDKSLLISKHWGRETIKQECDEIVRLNLAPKSIINKYYNKIIEEGFKDDYGLYCASVQIRKTRDKDLNELFDRWWGEFLKVQYRDQMILPYTMWKTNFKDKMMTINCNDLLKFVEHKSHRRI